MGKIILKKKESDYYFVLKAENGAIILTSEIYPNQEGCMKGIQAVKHNARNDERYTRKTSKNGRYYFLLVAENGEVIGTSEMYSTTGGREYGIGSVKYNTMYFTIEDATGD